MFFEISLYVLGAICVGQFLYARSRVDVAHNPEFSSFQRSYLIVYLLASAGDWLQGPHVYALYDFYGMSKHQIEILFVAGFGSSLLFGTIVGSVADKYGRKFNCLIYAVLYIGACITKHFNNIYILMVGRLLGGTATSILYSAFESWLVYEHNKRQFDENLLSIIFSHATLGNSVIAIVSGIAAQVAANFFGFVAPFDVAIIVLSLMATITMFTWPENYGDRKTGVNAHFIDAFYEIKNSSSILCLGLVQSLFEGAMYIFVLEWTPALSQASEESIPHGYIFASFMIAIMIGSSIYKLLQKFHRPESFMRFVLLLSSLCFMIPIFIPQSGPLVFIAFIVFEICVGVFWPSMGFMRGIYIPEQMRTTIMNLFRIPLNAIVIIILMQNLPHQTIFKCCVLFLGAASCTQHCLLRSVEWKFSGGDDPSGQTTPKSDVSVTQSPLDEVQIRTHTPRPMSGTNDAD